MQKKAVPSGTSHCLRSGQDSAGRAQPDINLMFFSSGLISDSSVFCDHIMRVHTILPKCHSLPFSSFSLTQPKLSVFIEVAMCAVEKTPHIQCTDCIQTTGVKTSWHELGPDLTKNLRKLQTHAAVTCQSQQPHPKTYPAILSILLLLGL